MKITITQLLKKQTNKKKYNKREKNRIHKFVKVFKSAQTYSPTEKKNHTNNKIPNVKVQPRLYINHFQQILIRDNITAVSFKVCDDMS